MHYPRVVVLAAILAALTPASGVAAPVACSPGTLSDYFASSDGCTGGTFLVDHFAPLAPLPTGATPISADSVRVIPVVSGLAFTFDVAADAGQLLEILFGYDVTSPAIGGASLAMTGASATGDGVVTAVKNYCEGGVFNPGGVDGCTGLPDALITFAIDGDSDLDESLLIFPTVAFLSVVDDIAVDGGLTGAASLSGSVTNQFVAAAAPNPVPEPTSALLVATGICGILRARYARSRRRPS